MKLSEAIAILESARTVQFEARLFDGRRVFLCYEEGYFMINIYTSHGEKIGYWMPGGAFNSNVRIDLDWQLVHEPVTWELIPQRVTWQEALQAWADGKKISYSYMGYDKRFDFENSNYMMSVDKIKKAEWYVED